jgi:hypothetical protein
VIFQSGSSSQLGGNVSSGELAAVSGRFDMSDDASDLPETDDEEAMEGGFEGPSLGVCSDCFSREGESKESDRVGAYCGR